MLSYFHCSAFSHGRAKTIRIRYVWTRFFGKRREKNLRFQTKTYTCGRGLSLLGNGNGKAINSTISVRTRAQSLLFSSNPNFPQSFKQLGPLENRKKSEIMGSLFFQRHFRGRRCCRIVRSLKFHLGA